MQKLVAKYFVYIEAVRWIFLQYFVNKSFGLGADFRRIFIVNVNNPFHCFFAADVVERSLAADHLVGQDSNAPNINTVIVALSPNDLRGHIVESSTIGGPSILANGRPSQIAQFAYILDKVRSTLVMTIFYGLMSLWRIELSCIYFNPVQICLSLYDASVSLNFLCFLMREKRLPPSMYSMIM